MQVKAQYTFYAYGWTTAQVRAHQIGSVLVIGLTSSLGRSCRWPASAEALFCWL